ncbi:MAG: tRNA (adenosine(37)-N6)-threonylcarbamoyltransferase complex dimerization subunit type 1 TsaB [Candidatus Caldatribacteriaceae bacterium]
MILALESSTPWLGIALAEGKEVLFHVVHRTQVSHSLLLVEYLKAIREQFDLEGKLKLVAVGLGPGSFTGVKVGNIIAKGLAYALGVPLAGFSTLEIMASRVLRAFGALRVVVPVIVHRRGEIFWSEFKGCGESFLPSLPLQVGSWEEFASRYRERPDILVATPWQSLAKDLEEAGIPCVDPSTAVPDALELVRLCREKGVMGNFENIFTMVPLYGSKVFER